MKKLVLTFLLMFISLFVSAAFGQQRVTRDPDCIRSFYFSGTTTSGVSLPFDNRNSGCTTWTLTYSSTGYSAVSIEMDNAPDSAGQPGSFSVWGATSLASGTLPLTATTQGQITAYKYFPWVDVKLNSTTGSGQITGTLYGYRPFGGQDSSAFGGNQIQGMSPTGSATVGNPVLVAGKDGSGNVQPIAMNTSGGVVTAINVGAGVDNLGNAALGQMVTSVGQIPLEVIPFVFNGANGWDRPRSTTLAAMPVATVLTSRNNTGAEIVEKGSRWAANSAPSAGSQATASIAAEASVRHVLDTLCFSSGSAVAPVLTSLQVNIRDGATGAGTVLATFEVEISAATGQNTPPVCIGGLNLVGTTNTAMTVEWSAGLANLKQTATAIGFNVN